MKKILCVILSLLMLLSICACKNNTKMILRSGSYYAVGDYEEGLTPYLNFNTKDNTFFITGGALMSFRQGGSYEIINDKLIAESEDETFVFEINNSKTITLIDDINYITIGLPKNTKFVYSTKIK